MTCQVADLKVIPPTFHLSELRLLGAPTSLVSVRMAINPSDRIALPCQFRCVSRSRWCSRQSKSDEQQLNWDEALVDRVNA